MKEWLRDRWSACIFRLYKTTNAYVDGLIHDAFMNELLDDLGAPRFLGSSRLPLSHYGRLRRYLDEREDAKETTKP